MSLDGSQVALELKAQGLRLGFTQVGIAPAVSPPGHQALEHWIDAGFAGEMRYFERRRGAYADPRFVLDGVRSVVMLTMPYAAEPVAPPLPSEPPFTGRVARYAWSRTDYHNTLRDRLAELADHLQTLVPGCLTRGVVDTAPLLERDFARLAGLGWFGKNTMLIGKSTGSYFFLAALLTDLALPVDAPHDASHCGTCTRCLDACPTDAFVAPYQLDARRCLSYLTIELRADVSVELRPLLGDWVLGCDICQEVCPWNRKPRPSLAPGFEPDARYHTADLLDWLELDPATFRARFKHTPFERPGRGGVLRNVALALGNVGDAKAIAPLCRVLGESDPRIRTAAAWAIGRLAERLRSPNETSTVSPTLWDAVRQAIASRRAIETEPSVQQELDATAQMVSSPAGL